MDTTTVQETAITPDIITNSPPIEVKEPARLSIKQRRFQKLYINSPNLTPSEIAAKVFQCKDNKSASTIACQCLKKLGISRLAVLEHMGLNDEADAADLVRLRKAKKVVSAVINGKDAGAGDTDFIEVDDNGTQLKALELTFKIKGAFSDEKIESGDKINNFLTIIESVNVANVSSPDKGIKIERSESDQLNKYLAQ